MRRLVLLAVFAASLLAPAAAVAHPLGNFTVNRYAAVELSGRDVFVHYVLDLAEIPTLQEQNRVSAERLRRGLVLELDGRRVPLTLVATDRRFRPGAGGLKTLRLEAVFRAGGTGSRLSLRDENYGSRIGWREVVVRAEGGATLERSSAPAESASRELRSYPKNQLKSPLDVRSATASFELGSEAGTPPQVGAAVEPRNVKSGFESLISEEDLSLGVILVALLVAAFWGAAHALTPGHGKAIVAGYLVGSRGRPRHAVALGLIVTITHTIGVFALGVITLTLSQFILPEDLYPWLTVASGLLVIGVGVSVLWARLRKRGAGDHHHHDHGHEHGHEHHHHHHHHDELSRRKLLGIGVAAGLLPCPSALVVLLSAIALHRIGFGLALIVAFSVGLAATVTGIGLVAVLAQQRFSRIRLDGPIVRALPAISALVILAVGVGITIRALPGVL